MPLYKTQFVLTMQDTSVVSLLAIEDMSRAVTVISSRTMDPVVALVITSIVYLLLGFIANRMLSLADRQQAPLQRGGGTMAMIHIEDLCKSYGDNLVFKNVNADIEKGDCVCIIGPLRLRQEHLPALPEPSGAAELRPRVHRRRGDNRKEGAAGQNTPQNGHGLPDLQPLLAQDDT